MYFFSLSSGTRTSFFPRNMLDVYNWYSVSLAMQNHQNNSAIHSRVSCLIQYLRYSACCDEQHEQWMTIFSLRTMSSNIDMSIHGESWAFCKMSIQAFMSAPQVGSDTLFQQKAETPKASRILAVDLCLFQTHRLQNFCFPDRSNMMGFRKGHVSQLCMWVCLKNFWGPLKPLDSC